MSKMLVLRVIYLISRYLIYTCTGKVGVVVVAELPCFGLKVSAMLVHQ